LTPRDHDDAIVRHRWHQLTGELATADPADPASTERLARLLLREAAALGIDIETAYDDLMHGGGETRRTT
jgi:hypothetical protein